MKKLNISIFTLAAFMLLVGCSDKENVQEPVVSGEPVLTTFRITAPNSYAYADDEPGTTEENKVSMVEFYMFDATGQRDESTTAYNYSYHKYVGTAQREISFLVKSGISKKFLIAVNGDLGELPGDNYEKVEQRIADLELSNANSQLAGAGNFLMSGKAVEDVIEDSTENEITIKVSRVLTKIDPPKKNEDEFIVSIPDEDLQVIFADETVTKENIEFDLTGYVVINGRTNSYIFTYYNADDKEYKVWDLWTPGGRNFPTDYDANGQITNVYSGTQDNSFWLTSATVFAFENQPKETYDEESGITGFEKKEVYAFLIQGTLTNTANNKSLTRYWRVNLIRDENYTITRNTIYRVTLDEVQTVGYETPKEAEEDEDGGKLVPKNDQTGIQATIEILEWRVKIQHTEF